MVWESEMLKTAVEVSGGQWTADCAPDAVHQLPTLLSAV